MPVGDEGVGMNYLYYGDNLEILQKYIVDHTVDLIYIDPPFNSSRDYNILFREADGAASDAQITAFEDCWHWTAAAEATFRQLVDTAPPALVEMMRNFRSFIGENDIMAYLTMMAIRLVELRRVLKDTGSCYLHCDPTASHYLRILLDIIFGKRNFQNELIWKRTSAHSDARRAGRVHDVIFLYSKSERTWTWNKLYTPYEKDYVESHYRKADPDGRLWYDDNLIAPRGAGPVYDWKGVTRAWRVTRENMERLEREGKLYYTEKGVPRYKRYLDEMPGLPLQDVWTDIFPINSQAKERLGYPTQKPLALLERIIRASSNPGDVVLDAFCGCGTTIDAAQKLGRRWIGIDITHLAIALIKNRLRDRYGPNLEYEVIGEPRDVPSARQLAQQDRYQFQWWALSLVPARPVGDRKKGADQGIDGVLYFLDDKGQVKKIVIQVKSGKVSVKDIRELAHVVERHKAQIGALLTLEEPTKPMITEALGQGVYHSPTWKRDYPRLQIRTIAQLLSGYGLDYPPSLNPGLTFKKAEKDNFSESQEAKQGGLLINPES